MKYLSLQWETARKSRIGSSEIFGLVKYYATDKELLNVGIDPVELKAEKDFSSAFYLYHKVIGTEGLYKNPLPISLGEYGLAVETYAQKVMKDNGTPTISQEVFLNDKCVASCDLITKDKSTIIEIKTVNKFMQVDGMNWRTNIQHQYQMWVAGVSFGKIFEVVLRNDSTEYRCWLAGLHTGSKKKFINEMSCNSEYHIYEDNYNPALGQLFEVVITRFFDDVKNRNEPSLSGQFGDDKKKILLERVRTGVSSSIEYNLDLSVYAGLKQDYDVAKEKLDEEKARITDAMYDNDTATITSTDGTIQLKMDSRGAIREKQLKKGTENE